MRPPPAERSPAERLRFGVVALDKPSGPTSHQVSAWVRDAADVEVGARGGDDGTEPGTDGVDSAAHTGTLDPKVTGCLPVLTGAATRLAGAFDRARKAYVAVLELHAPVPTDFEAVVGEFEGPLLQRPPRHSAVARELRTRTVYGLRVLERERRRALLRIDCEAGTYVRKLCHDLGLALGTGAHMGDLRRVRAGPFDDREFVTMHDLIDALAFARQGEPGALSGVVEPAERALVGLPRVTIADSAAEQVARGATVYAPGVLAYDAAERPLEDAPARPAPDADTPPTVVCYTPGGSAVCLGRLVGDPDADRGVVVDLDRVLV
jgi:tRNA pseudouridine55 synthase